LLSRHWIPRSIDCFWFQGSSGCQNLYRARFVSLESNRGARGRLSAELTGQQVIILKEGTSRSRGRDAQKANIVAAKIIAESIKSTHRTKDMNKMLVNGFGDVTITHDA